MFRPNSRTPPIPRSRTARAISLSASNTDPLYPTSSSRAARWRRLKGVIVGLGDAVGVAVGPGVGGGEADLVGRGGVEGLAGTAGVQAAMSAAAAATETPRNRRRV